MLKDLGISIVVTIASIVIGIQFGYVTVEPELDPHAAIPQPPYTYEELAIAERQMRESLRKDLEQWAALPPLEAYRQARVGGQFYSWVPWFVLPILYSIRRPTSVALVMLVPSLSAMAGILLVFETGLCVIALLAGVGLVKGYRDWRRARERHSNIGQSDSEKR